MTLRDLQIALQRAADNNSEFTPDEIEVRIAYQPNYPLEASISEYTDIDVAVLDTGELDVDGESNRVKAVIYLAEGDSNEYLSSEGREILGW